MLGRLRCLPRLSCSGSNPCRQGRRLLVAGLCLSAETERLQCGYSSWLNGVSGIIRMDDGAVCARLPIRSPSGWVSSRSPVNLIYLRKAAGYAGLSGWLSPGLLKSAAAVASCLAEDYPDRLRPNSRLPVLTALALSRVPICLVFILGVAPTSPRMERGRL